MDENIEQIMDKSIKQIMDKSIKEIIDKSINLRLENWKAKTDLMNIKEYIKYVYEIALENISPGIFECIDKEFKDKGIKDKMQIKDINKKIEWKIKKEIEQEIVDGLVWLSERIKKES